MKKLTTIIYQYEEKRESLIMNINIIPSYKWGFVL